MKYDELILETNNLAILYLAYNIGAKVYII